MAMQTVLLYLLELWLADQLVEALQQRARVYQVKEWKRQLMKSTKAATMMITPRMNVFPLLISYVGGCDRVSALLMMDIDIR